MASVYQYKLVRVTSEQDRSIYTSIPLIKYGKRLSVYKVTWRCGIFRNMYNLYNIHLANQSCNMLKFKTVISNNG